MKDTIDKIMAEIEGFRCKSAKEAEELRIRLLGKKGSITALFEQFKQFDKDQKREFGARLNALKQAATAKIEEFRSGVMAAAADSKSAARECVRVRVPPPAPLLPRPPFWLLHRIE